MNQYKTYILLFLFFSRCIVINAQCDLRIDTTKILNNKNLDSLITLLTRTTLVNNNNTNGIPSFVTRELNCLKSKEIGYDTSFSIANPGEMYNQFDFITEGLPNRQLTYLGIGKNMMLLNYHFGGIGAGTYHTMIVCFDGQKITDFWIGQTAKAKTKAQILKWLRKYKTHKQTVLEI